MKVVEFRDGFLCSGVGVVHGFSWSVSALFIISQSFPLLLGNVAPVICLAECGGQVGDLIAS